MRGEASVTLRDEAEGAAARPAAAARLDVLVIGGGPAGSAAAIELARTGRRVAVLERAVGPHDKVCGEFLSGEAVEDLSALGLDVARLGAVRIGAVRLAGRLGVHESRLPFAAVSVSRKVLDEALLQCAESAGALVLRGRTAEGVVRSPAGWCAEVTGPERSYALEARDVVLATGKHDLRGLPRPTGVQNDLVAFKMHMQLDSGQADELGDRIELMLFQQGYGGLQTIESGAANLCCVVEKNRLRHLGGGWNAVLDAMCSENPQLKGRLEGARPLFHRALAIGVIPYGFVRRDAIAEGLWAVGDQAAVIPSFTGDGMALALHSGRLAAQMLMDGARTEVYQRRLYDQLKRQVGIATVLSRAMVAQPQRSVLEMAVRVWPRGLRAIAASTRLAERHRLRAARVDACAPV